MTYLFETAEHAQLRKNVRRWAAEHIAPHGTSGRRRRSFRSSSIDAGADGMLGTGYPESVGGAGGDVTQVCVAAAEMILAGKSVGTTVLHQVASEV